MTTKEELLLWLMEQVASVGGIAPAADIAAAWTTIVRRLMPLIGAGSVLLIFGRSLEAHRTAFPWLLGLPPTVHAEFAIEQLRTSMAAQGSDEMLAAHQALLATFIDQLTTLIGTRLTVRFLRAAGPADPANRTTEEKPG